MFTLLLLPMVGDYDRKIMTQDNVMIPAGHIAHDPIYIDDDADFLSQAIAESWQGNGSMSSPYRIENYIIDVPSGYQGIQIDESVTVHYIIDNCTIYSKTMYGTGVWMAGGIGTITNCEIHHVYHGILVDNANKTVKGNKIYDFQREGIILDKTTNAKVLDNTIIGYTTTLNESYHPKGVQSLGMFPYNTNALIENNTISNCLYGINSEMISTTFIMNNITRCEIGYIEYGDSNYFTNNTITFNTEVGIQMIASSESNSIYYNYILNNSVNAEDNGVSNSWDDGELLGNFWNEGFGAVYEISGDANAMDRYPFYIESIPPVLEDITEVTLTLGSALTTIVWDAVDLTPNQFWVYVNDLLFLSGEWNYDTIAVDFSSLTEGDYSVTMIIQDKNGFSASDQMILHMIVERVGGLDMLLVVGGVAVILVVIVVIVYLKKR